MEEEEHINPFTCCECGKPISNINYSSDDGLSCVSCAYSTSLSLPRARKRIIRDSFVHMLLPLILLGVAMAGTEILGAIKDPIPVYVQIPISILVYASLFYGIYCGIHFTDRFKVYVGEPDSSKVIVDVGESWTGNYWAKARTQEQYSMSQIVKILYNIFMAIVGTIGVFLIGWICFIVTCVKYNRKKIRNMQNAFLDELKEESARFEFHPEEAIANLDDNKFVVLPVHFVEDLTYLPIHYKQDGSVTYIYGVIKLANGLPAPIVVLYYKDLNAALPARGSIQLLSEETTQEEAFDAINCVPNQMDYLNTYFKKTQQKLLGVPALNELDDVEFDAKGNVINYPSKDKEGKDKDEKGTKSQAKAKKVVDDDDDDDDFKYKVVLKEVGDHKTKLVRKIAELTGIDLDDAKEIVDDAPNSVVKDEMEEAEAKELASALEEVGAVVKVKISK